MIMQERFGFRSAGRKYLILAGIGKKMLIFTENLMILCRKQKNLSQYVNMRKLMGFPNVQSEIIALLARYPECI